jgi:hypothetical protein
MGAAKPSVRLLGRVRDPLRWLHYSYRIEQQCLLQIRRFTRFSGKRHPSEMAPREVEESLTHFAVGRPVSDSIRNQALAVILSTSCRWRLQPFAENQFAVIPFKRQKPARPLQGDAARRCRAIPAASSRTEQMSYPC